MFGLIGHLTNLEHAQAVFDTRGVTRKLFYNQEKVILL